MNIRKVLAGGMAALTAGATVAFGAFAQSANIGDYVTVTNGVVTSPKIVVASYAGIAPPARRRPPRPRPRRKPIRISSRS